MTRRTGNDKPKSDDNAPSNGQIGQASDVSALLDAGSVALELGPRFMTTKQAAEHFACKPRQFIKLADAEGAQYLNVGGSESRPDRRYRVDKLKEFEAKRTRDTWHISVKAAAPTATTFGSGVSALAATRERLTKEKQTKKRPD